ncbi:hypothetical protein AAG747_17610 [Rapidithrix thailandica]|uniref:Uncharacterized protein n=1 Tax=Rapidithrix thailandica TaxID=413964 RepID=A0AAW9S3F5_9BACT
MNEIEARILAYLINMPSNMCLLKRAGRDKWLVVWLLATGAPSEFSLKAEELLQHWEDFAFGGLGGVTAEVLTCTRFALPK